MCVKLKLGMSFTHTAQTLHQCIFWSAYIKKGNLKCILSFDEINRYDIFGVYIFSITHVLVLDKFFQFNNLLNDNNKTLTTWPEIKRKSIVFQTTHLSQFMLSGQIILYKIEIIS